MSTIGRNPPERPRKLGAGEDTVDNSEEGLRTRVHGARTPVDLFCPNYYTVTRAEYYANRDHHEDDDAAE